MARSTTGKWVQRAASTGGSRSYRGQRPSNWYGALVVIVILGVVSVIWARYEYRHPSSAAPKAQPTVGQTWYTAFGFDICGVQKPALPPAPISDAASMTTDNNGVITNAPKTSAQAGDNATLGLFVSDYRGMELTSDTIRYPGEQAYTNGDKCPKGTPDAGKAGTVQVAYWPQFSLSTSQRQLISDPTTLKLGNLTLLTMNFLPPGAKISKPPPTAELAMLKLNEASASSTAQSTTPVSPSTTVAPSATTAPTTTVPKSTTTTAKGAP